MRWLWPVPTISTHRSRGMLMIEAPPLRSWRRIMMVSLRRPLTSSVLPTAAESLASGSNPSRVSEPTSR